MVELAIVLSSFFVLVLGMIELSRLGMVSQLLSDASRESCRLAVLNGKSQSDVTNMAQTLLNCGRIQTYTLTTTPTDVTTSHYGDQVTVTISVTFNNVSWLSAPRFLRSAPIKASATMSSERP
jgi:Flp pilus assembly protein TadG